MRIYILLISLCVLTGKLFSQTQIITVTGPAIVSPGSTETYGALANYPTGTITWSVLGGTIIPPTTNFNCTVLWNNTTGKGSVTAYDAANSITGKLMVQRGTQQQELCMVANAGNDVTICQGSSATLGGSPAVPGYTYSWSPTTGLSNPRIAQPTANPNTTTTYTLTMTPPNLIQNGDFESGNAGFQSDYLPLPASLTGSGQGSYVITTDPDPHNTLWCHTSDHTGNGNGMMVDGYWYGYRFWYSTATVAPNTQYNFSFWAKCVYVNSWYTERPAITIRINNQIVASNQIISGDNCSNTWIHFNIPWSSGINTQANIELIDETNVALGNDFLIDDISLTKCPISVDDITVCVCGTPPPPVTVTRKIPLSVPFQMYKWTSGSGQYCFDPVGQFHDHPNTYENFCGSSILMSGYMMADNGLPSYQSVDIAFNMYPRNFGYGPVLYLPSYGAFTQDHFIPPSDIISAELNLFHYNTSYPTCFSTVYPLWEFTLNQAHNGPNQYSNSFTITRSNHFFDYNSCDVNGTVNYDNPPQTYPSDVINVYGPANSNQDYALDVTQMTKNGVNNYMNQSGLGFQIKQVNQTGIYNNVLFQGQIFPINTNDHPYLGEPYIELTYIYRPPSNCSLTRPTNDKTQSLTTNINKPQDTLPALLNPLLNEIKLFPNPANSYVTVISPNQMRSLEIYNLEGKLVKQINLKGEVYIDISMVNFESGYYFIKIITNEGLKYTKLLVQH